ncbi:MAG: hypothetical protein ABMA14_01540 [Hyphomonadaceae bacterium]
MDTAEECILKADNYASAAMLVAPKNARGLVRLAAIWRNRALRLKLGDIALNSVLTKLQAGQNSARLARW